MNNCANQKAIEKEVFEQFLRLQKGIIPEDIIPVYGDEPDVIVELAENKKIGVEIRELNISEKARELESIENDICREAAGIYIQRRLESLSVIMTFSPYAGLTNPSYRVADWSTKRKMVIAEELASQVEREAELLSEGQSCSFRPVKIPEISNVHIGKSPVKTKAKHLWRVSNAGLVSSSIVPLIQRALDDKNKKHDKYLNKCDECWLLLEANRGYKAKRLFFKEEDCGHKFISKFNRAFFMERTHNCCHELYLDQRK